MTNVRGPRSCHRRDSSNIPIKSVEIGEWSREPVATDFRVDGCQSESVNALGRPGRASNRLVSLSLEAPGQNENNETEREQARWPD